MFKVMSSAVLAGTFCCALLTAASAQNASERDIAVVQKPLVELAPADSGDLKVTTSVDHPNGVYRIGDEVRVSVRTNKDAYVTILDVGTSGSTTVIFPNRSARSNRVRANQKLTIPAAGATWKFQTMGPTGTEVLKIIVSTSPKPIFKDGDIVSADIFEAFKDKGAEAARDIAVVLNTDHPKQWTQAVEFLRLRK